MLSTLTSACAGRANQDLLAGIKKVGLLTVTVDRVGEQPSDEEIMRTAAARAVGAHEQAMNKLQKWQVVPLETYKNDARFAGFSKLGESTVVRAELEKLAAKGKLGPADMTGAMEYMRAQMSGNEAEKKRVIAASVEPAQRQFAQMIADKARPYVAATGTPVIPFSVLKPEGGAHVVKMKAGNAQQSSPEERLQELLTKSIGGLAAALGLDALAVVYVRTAVKATVGIGVITGSRGLDSLKMAPTVMLIDKEGRTAIDMGFPVLDDLSSSKMALPVYKIVFSPQGKHIHPSTKQRFDYVIDLKDPEGKVLPAAESLSAEVADKLWRDAGAAMAK